MRSFRPQKNSTPTSRDQRPSNSEVQFPHLIAYALHHTKLCHTYILPTSSKAMPPLSTNPFLRAPPVGMIAVLSPGHHHPSPRSHPSPTLRHQRRLIPHTLLELSVSTPRKKGSKLITQLPAAEFVIESFGDACTLFNQILLASANIESQFMDRGRLRYQDSRLLSRAQPRFCRALGSA